MEGYFLLNLPFKNTFWATPLRQGVLRVAIIKIIIISILFNHDKFFVRLGKVIQTCRS